MFARDFPRLRACALGMGASRCCAQTTRGCARGSGVILTAALGTSRRSSSGSHDGTSMPADRDALRALFEQKGDGWLMDVSRTGVLHESCRHNAKCNKARKEPLVATYRGCESHSPAPSTMSAAAESGESGSAASESVGSTSDTSVGVWWQVRGALQAARPKGYTRVDIMELKIKKKLTCLADVIVSFP